MSPPLLSTGETARVLGISIRTLQRWVRDGIVTPDFTTAGGHHRFDPEHVRDQLRARRERTE
ncbi:MAG: helix-turn-helix domain-containing protein [Pseudonocardiaceae bacterium]